MNKSAFAKKSLVVVESSSGAGTPAASPNSSVITLAQFWLLDTGTAKKLGLRSTGSLSYQVLADHDRTNLFIALTQNDGG